MKKFKLLLMGILTLVVLAACGSKETMGTSDVLAKAIEESKKVESYSMDMKMDMEVMGMEQTIEAKGDVTQNPDAMHLTMSMGVLGMDMDVEMYATEDEAYMNMFEQWIKVDPEELGMTGFDQYSEEELGKLEKFEEHFEMKEEENEYVLTLSGDKKEYIELVEDLMLSSMNEELVADETLDFNSEELMESLKINDFEMEIYIDKETFLQTKQVFNVDMEIEGMEMKMKGVAKISKVNKVDPIEIPAEVIENAITEDDMFGAGMFDTEVTEEDFDDFDDFESEEEIFYTIEEMREQVSFQFPEPSQLPEGYVFTEGYYDGEYDLVGLSYDKDFENWIMIEINPVDFLGLADMDGEPIAVRGGEGLLYEDEIFRSLYWEQDGLLIDLTVSGSELTTEQMLEIAESF